MSERPERAEVNYRADRIRVTDLAEAVQRAVEVADLGDKAQLQRGIFGVDDFRVPYWIVGRQIRGDLGAIDAYGAAERITQQVAEDLRIDVLPAVTIINKDILIGFVERERVLNRSFDLNSSFGQSR